MAELASIAEVKAYLSLTTGADDALLAGLIASESAFILSWLSRDFEVALRTELFSGNGRTERFLSHTPVQAVTAVKVGGTTIPAAASPEEPGFFLYEDRVLLCGYRFAWGHVCRIVYDAGVEEVPADVRQACVELVALRYRTRERIGLKSKGLAGEVTSFETAAMPEHVRGILRPYRKVMLP